MVQKRSVPTEVATLSVKQLKRYAYSTMIGLGILSMLTVLVFGSPTFDVSPATAIFNRFVYPTIIALLSWIIWAILRQRIDVEKFEKPLVALGFVFIVSKFSLTLLAAPELLPLSHVESWYWMFMGMWVFSFLAFPFFQALYVNATTYILMLTATVVNAWLKVGTEPGLFLDTLSDIAASNFRYGGALIAVVVVGYIKHQWAFVEKEAMMLRSLAHEDALTGLPNRRWLSRVLQDAVENAQNSLTTVILFDLDGFKRVNDDFGHNIGDEVLKEISELAEHCVRTADTLGRWGGEEFLVVCPDTNLAEGVHLAERLRHMLENHPMQHGQTITGSFGVAQWQRGESLEQLIARADDALYAAKGQGKNQVCSSLVGRSLTAGAYESATSTASTE